MKIALIGNYGAKNTGDEMILEGLIETLKEIVPSAEILVLSGDPPSTTHRHNVKSVEKFPAGIRSFLRNSFGKKTKAQVEKCDYVIVGGGGLFASVTFKANLIWALQIWHCYRLKKPVIMYGQSLGVIKNSVLKWLIKKLFNRAIFIAVRDQESKVQLAKIGVHKEIVVMPDLAFKLQLSNENIERQNKVIVCLRFLKTLPPNFQSELIKFLDWLTDKHNCKLVFVDFQKGEEDDTHLNKDILLQLKNLAFTSYIKEIHDVNELFKHFQKCSFAITMRFHSMVTAIKTNTPFIAISYASKVHNFLETHNLEKQSLQMDELSFDRLKDLFQETFANKEKAESALETLNKDLSEEFKTVEAKLKNILSKTS